VYKRDNNVPYKLDENRKKICCGNGHHKESLTGLHRSDASAQVKKKTKEKLLRKVGWGAVEPLGVET